MIVTKHIPGKVIRVSSIQGKAKQITVRVPHIPSYNTETDIENSIHQLKEIGLSDFDRFTYRT